jgi:hypothetical protein
MFVSPNKSPRCPRTYHFPWRTVWHWLRPVLFLQPYVYFMLADPAIPISPTYVAAGYPLCKPSISPTGAHGVSTFVSQMNNKHYFFLHEIIALYEQASSHTS